MVAEAANHLEKCTCRKQFDNRQAFSHICSAFCPIGIAQSMSYIASALTLSRPTSANSADSATGTPSMPSDSTSEELFEGPGNGTTQATPVIDSDKSPKMRRASGARTKTVYRLALPPPVIIHKQRLHIRPKVLLQLQKVSRTCRPTPIYEVLPSHVAPKLAKHFPRTFKGKARLGVDDLVVVTSDDYHLTESYLNSNDVDDLFEDVRWGKREIVAAICHGHGKDHQGNTEISLSQGQSWTASRLKSGAYEFVSTDGSDRSVARWVPKQSKTRRTSSDTRDRSLSEERKFNFSLLNPNSRRHAVIATLDRQSIEVCDQYSNPSLSQSSQTSSSSTTSSSSWSEEHQSLSKRPNLISSNSIDVDLALRTLITVTGIWVSFQEGISRSFKYSDASPTLSASPNPASKQDWRTLSLSSASFSHNQASQKSLAPDLGGPHRSPLQHTRSSPAVPLSPSFTASPYPFSPPRRSISSGTALMQRISSRRSSTNKRTELSPVGDEDGSEAERETSRAAGSPLQRRASRFKKRGSIALERAVTGLALGEPRSYDDGMIGKSSRLGRLFSHSTKMT